MELLTSLLELITIFIGTFLSTINVIVGWNSFVHIHTILNIVQMIFIIIVSSIISLFLNRYFTQGKNYNCALAVLSGIVASLLNPIFFVFCEVGSSIDMLLFYACSLFFMCLAVGIVCWLMSFFYKKSLRQSLAVGFISSFSAFLLLGVLMHFFFNVCKM